ncbi:MAG: quinate/shikimate dehydrogenase [Lachnospiraceae bacterium]|nr:quinate/shikimate dehydrogenase [Lachnospiraceae bacterium]
MQISGHTRLGCLLGSPVAHSISPAMYNESFRLLDIDYVYLCFDTSHTDLGTMVRILRDMNVFGFNLTMPDKERIMEHLDDISDAARMIGAVNTVKNEDGRLVGYNTDGIGYIHSMQSIGYDFTGGAMSLLGAGGAASSIAVQAALSGVPVLHILNRKNGRSFPNAIRLAEQINAGTSCKADVTDLNDPAAVRQALEGSSLLTNATSVGMAPHTDGLPIADLSCLHPELTVSDIIYNPRRTRLLEEADKIGCRTSNGLYMLLYQGEAAFRIWTGQDMPVEAIRAKYFSDPEA